MKTSPTFVERVRRRLVYDPFILRYKDNPRFAAFCRKVGLPTPAEVAVQKT